MARFFTYSWQYAEARKESEAGPLAHAAGSRFSRRGIVVSPQLCSLLGDGCIRWCLAVSYTRARVRPRNLDHDTYYPG